MFTYLLNICCPGKGFSPNTICHLFVTSSAPTDMTHPSKTELLCGESGSEWNQSLWKAISGSGSASKEKSGSGSAIKSTAGSGFAIKSKLDSDSHRRRGLYFGRKRIFIPPPPWEIYIFSQKKQRDFRATLLTTK